MMKIQDFKIKVTPEQSKIVQETLFENDVCWASGKIKIDHLNAPYLYIRDNILTLTDIYNKNDTYFKDQKLPELSFADFKSKYIDMETTINALPQKWCVRMINQEVVDYCNKYGRIPPYDISSNLYAHFPPIDGCKTISYTKEIDYTLISFERFKKLIIDTKEFVIPDKFCVYTNNPDIIKWFEQKLRRNIIYNDKGSAFHYPEFNGCCTGHHTHTELGYIEITEDQFTEHFLKPKTMEDKEIIGYKLKDQKYFVPASLLIFSNTDGISHWKDGNIMTIEEFPNLVKQLDKEGVLNLWFEPVYKKQSKTLYFGKVAFEITPGEKFAKTKYGKISMEQIKNAIDYISNPPLLIGHEFNIHIGSSEPKSLVDIGRDAVNHHKIGFGCQSGTLDELINIYNTFK